MRRLFSSTGLLCAALVLPLLLASCSSNGGLDDATVAVQLLALNDFHGNLEQPASGFPRAATDTEQVIISGGIARLATLVKQRAAGHRHSLVVGAGDLIGASPLLSSRFHDEPTIEALSAIGMSLSAVGNHEFDEGLTELRRMQQGGCHPDSGCQGPAPFTGAGFQYLAANVIDDSSNQPIFPAHAIREFDGIRVGFIGLTLDETPSLVAPTASHGMHFLDEVTTINREVALLRADGIEAVVVLLHEGGSTRNGPEDCANLGGPITAILPNLDTAVDVVISGHTHRAYDCEVNGILLTSAGQYGTQLSDITLTLDRSTGDIVQASAETLVVAADTLAEDPAIATLVDSYKMLAAPLMQRQVGAVTAPLSRDRNTAGESVMGAVIADAMQAAAARSTGENIDVAFMNPGGVRGDIPAAGPVVFAVLFTIQPIGNSRVVLTLRGADIAAQLNQQFTGGNHRILHVSAGFMYRWHQRGADAEVITGSIMLNGAPLQPERQYRVVTNNFTAAGGDGFTVFAAGENITQAGVDVEALESFLAAQPLFTPPPLGRITLEP